MMVVQKSSGLYEQIRTCPFLTHIPTTTGSHGPLMKTQSIGQPTGQTIPRDNPRTNPHYSHTEITLFFVFLGGSCGSYCSCIFKMLHLSLHKINQECMKTYKKKRNDASASPHWKMNYLKAIQPNLLSCDEDEEDILLSLSSLLPATTGNMIERQKIYSNMLQINTTLETSSENNERWCKIAHTAFPFTPRNSAEM